MTEIRSVLIVEDNPVLGESMAFALSTFGWHVIGPVASNEEALAVIDSNSADVAVLDVDLGLASSVPCAKALREREIPFVFLTGLESNANLPDEFQNETWLPKPVQPDTLVSTLESVLGRGAGA